MEYIKILNTKILSLTQTEMLNNLKQGVLCTPNLDHLVKLQKDKSFYDVYSQSDWVVCDSKILYVASKLLKHSIKEPIPGSDFFPAFYTYHKDNPECRIFLMGAAEGIAQKAQENINRKVGREIVVGAHSPTYGFEKDEKECEELVGVINRSGATVLLVGVGAPKQEKWIGRYKDQLPGVKIFMALGATIDFEAGTLKRAPRLAQNIGMEWFYRFLKEPRRLFKRYFVDDLAFFWYFGKQLLGIYKDPFKS